jgi:cell division initiation protein
VTTQRQNVVIVAKHSAMRSNDGGVPSGDVSGGVTKARPPFDRVRKGWDPNQVGPYLDRIERERAAYEATNLAAQAQIRELQSRLHHFELLEDELTRSVHLAKQTGDAIIEDARARAAEVVADGHAQAESIIVVGRQQLAEEERSLDGLRMAVAAEAAKLKEVEQRVATRISRAAAALVELVDAPGGLGPFSQATATLLEFAQLLQNTSRTGMAVEVRVELDNGVTVARVAAPNAGGEGRPSFLASVAPPREAASA